MFLRDGRSTLREARTTRRSAHLRTSADEQDLPRMGVDLEVRLDRSAGRRRRSRLSLLEARYREVPDARAAFCACRAVDAGPRIQPRAGDLPRRQAGGLY